jgi:predicted dehydrogenase
MTAPFRALLVGYGNRGRMWAEIVGRGPDTALAAVVDPDPARRAACAEAHPETPTFASLGAALAAGRYDGVVLVTPPYGRVEQAQQVFAAGLPLLAEKPLTLDLGEAVAIVGMAEAHALPLMVGLNFRYLPVSQRLRALLAAAALGQPGFGQFSYLRNRDGRRPGLNKYPLAMRHPMMLEQSIHHLDLIRFCYGREVEQVACRTWNPPWSMYAHDSNVSCLLSMEGGLEVNYQGTWTAGWNELDFAWRTDCAGGVIVQRKLFEDLALARLDEPALTPIALPAAEPFYDDTAALLGAFVAHLRDGAPLECDGRDHLRTLALCFAAIESSEAHAVVALSDVYRRYAIPLG